MTEHTRKSLQDKVRDALLPITLTALVMGAAFVFNLEVTLEKGYPSWQQTQGMIDAKYEQSELELKENRRVLDDMERHLVTMESNMAVMQKQMMDVSRDVTSYTSGPVVHYRASRRPTQ